MFDPPFDFRITEVDGAEERLAAAEILKKRLELILGGEAPYDIFVRWKPIEKQPIGCHFTLALKRKAREEVSKTRSKNRGNCRIGGRDNPASFSGRRPPAVRNGRDLCHEDPGE